LGLKHVPVVKSLHSVMSHRHLHFQSSSQILNAARFRTLCNLYFDIYPTRYNVTQFSHLRKLLYMFRVVSPPIIRSTYNCIYRISCLSNFFVSSECELKPLFPKAHYSRKFLSHFHVSWQEQRTALFLPHTLHVCGRNLITGLTSAASPRVDISSTCKLGQKLGVPLPLLTCSSSA